MLRRIAEGYYKQGYNCAEAMLRAINMAWGLRLSDGCRLSSCLLFVRSGLH